MELRRERHDSAPFVLAVVFGGGDEGGFEFSTINWVDVGRFEELEISMLLALVLLALVLLARRKAPTRRSRCLVGGLAHDASRLPKVGFVVKRREDRCMNSI